MPDKKIGLLNRNSLERKQGNFEVADSYIPKEEDKMILPVPEKKKKENKGTFTNQQGSVKLPISTKNELDALKIMNKTKFDYEIIQLLIDNYTNTFSADKMKKFKLLKEMSFDD